MCGRYYIDDNSEYMMGLVREIAAGPDGNRIMDMKLGEIFPTNTVPVITSERPRLMQWGFARYNGGGKVINARSETATEKSMFAKSMRERRCLLPASWYFEWQRVGSTKKQKHAISLPDGAPLAMAGVFREEKDIPLPVFVILTREAAPGLSQIHDRMPVILAKEMQREWLSTYCDIKRTLHMATEQLDCFPVKG